jgi:hypothetical protein
MIHGGDPEADYPEAVDPIDAHRTYTETNIPVPEPEEPDDLDEDNLYKAGIKGGRERQLPRLSIL